jgi:hypothetical protein
MGRVDSWALSPAGSADPEAAGNRSNLSYSVDPGATIDDAITVYNFGNVQLTFGVYATDARNNADGGFDALRADEEPEDLGTWIKIPEGFVTVNPGEQVTMPITIEVPADAQPGDHIAVVMAANDAEGVGPDGKTVNLERRTGTRVYLRVSGPVHPELAVENVKTVYEPSLNPFSGKVDVRYTLRNRGNVRLSGSYVLSVSGPFGVAKRRVPAKDLEELLPGEDVTFSTSFSGVPATGISFATVSLTPADLDGAEPVSVVSRRSFGLAPPITVIMLLLATWLGLRARRAYRRHRYDDSDPARVPKEVQPA